MKILVVNYSFDASARQVTLTDYNPVVIERLLMITNTTDGIVIYQFNDPAKGGTASTNIVTLDYDTTTMDDADKLQIFYDDNATTIPISGTITATVDTSLLATSAKQLADGHSVALSATDNAVLDDIALNQTDASQKTQIVDGTGNVIGATLNALDVNIKSGNPTTIAVTQGTATSLKAQAEVYQGGSAVAVGNPLEVTLPAATVSTLTPPAAITGFATSAKQLADNHQVTVSNIASAPVISGFSTETTLSAINAKLVTGTDIGDVTINNAAGASAVNIQDGGNAITVDGTVAITSADIASIKTAVEVLDNIVAGSEAQVDVVTLPVGHNIIDSGTVTAVTSITNPVAVTGTFYQATQPVSGTVTANLSATDNAVLDDIAANQTDASQKTQIVDGSGNVIGATSNALDVNIKSGASAGEQYADGTLVNAAYKGTIALGTDGSNYQALSVDATGNMNVNIVSNAGSGGTASDDDADFTAGSTAGTPAIGVYESSPTSVTDGDLGIVGITAARRLKTSATIDAALPAGTNAIGKLSANSGIDIGDVDVTSLPVGHNIIDSGTVTAVTSITNVVHVDDNAGALTVDGTVTANLSATDNAVLDAIQSNTYDILDAVSNASGNSNTMDATLTAINNKLVTGTDIGDVTINNASGASAVNIQDGGNTITVDGTVAVTNAGLTALAGAITGTEAQVDVVTLPVGHNIIDSGTVTAVTSITNPVAVTGTFYQATQPVSGTVTANLSATDNAVLDNIQTSVDAINAKMVTGTDIGDVTINNASLAVTGTFWQATQPVSIATVPSHAVTNAGTFAVQVDGAALTALQLIDNAISGAGFNITQFAGSAVPIGAGLEATALRVTLATDSTGVVGHNITGIGHGVKTVTTAGTDEALAASTPCKRVTIQAQTDNTSLIAVGGSGVDATIATGTGVVLYPGDVFELDIDNLADIYIDSLVSTEGVRFTYFT